MIANGFQWLALLNSAGYQRAELPLDDAVSLIAPNNTGKTSLINALQFLLIIDRRRMDFGAHDWTKTRRFYFPDNSAYILLEVLLPQTGTVVLGCVGKGISHEYEYFAYQGDLKLDDFRRDNGQLVHQNQLIEHLATKGRTAYRYDSRDFAKLIYGGLPINAGDPDFTVFRLEKSSDAKVFQEILTSTLRLDKLSSQKVKGYLQKIFRHDLYDYQVDFKQEWDKAFHEVNADRAQYEAAVSQQSLLAQLEAAYETRLAVRGQLVAWREHINDGLERWQAHYDSTQAQHQTTIDELQARQARFLDELQDNIKAKNDTEHHLSELNQADAEQKVLANRFVLLPDNGRDLLEEQLAQAQQQLDELSALLHQTKGRNLAAIKADVTQKKQQIAQLTQQLDHADDNLYQQLSEALPTSNLNKLTRSLSRDALLQEAGQFELDGHALLALLQDSADDTLTLPGLTLQLDRINPQYQPLSREELKQQLDDAKQQLASLEKQWEAAQSAEKTRKEREQKRTEVKSLEADIEAFERWQTLKAQAQKRQASIARQQTELTRLQQRLDNAQEQNQDLSEQLESSREQLKQLNRDHQRITKLRDNRLDLSDTFSWLADLPQTPWLEPVDWPLEALADQLQQYQTQCQKLLDLNRELHNDLTSLRTGGLTKFDFSETEDEQLSRLIAFSHQLPREREALEKKARSAVVNVTGSLRNLRDNLYALQNCLRDFNRQIGKRRLSDLAVFRIEAREEAPLVEAIDLLINKAEQVESGDNFSLFNQQSVLDDDKLARAKQRLIEEGDARHGLRVGDLFRLEFALGKAGQAVDSFEDIDSAASNGTVLMAKLVTGLAMLYQMQDKRTPFRAICYLDEALALDNANQKSLIATAAEFGFALIFASPAPWPRHVIVCPFTRKMAKTIFIAKAAKLSSR